MKQYRILVAGAGIGGLTAASCLMKAGHDVEIHEQAPQLGKLRLGRGVARKPFFELARLGGSRLPIECRVHQFQKSRLSHVSPAESL